MQNLLLTQNGLPVLFSTWACKLFDIKTLSSTLRLHILIQFVVAVLVKYRVVCFWHWRCIQTRKLHHLSVSDTDFLCRDYFHLCLKIIVKNCLCVMLTRFRLMLCRSSHIPSLDRSFNGNENVPVVPITIAIATCRSFVRLLICKRLWFFGILCAWIENRNTSYVPTC